MYNTRAPFEDLQVETLKKWYQEASDLIVSQGMNPLPKVSITIPFRYSRNTCGCCYYKRYTSEGENGPLHPIEIRMYKNHFTSLPQIKETLMHEAAHAYCVEYYQETGHTPLFARVAKALGSTGTKYKQDTDSVVKADAQQQERVNDFLNHGELTKKDIHAMRCSFKGICRKYSLPLDAVSFNTYVAPRYRHIFTQEQISFAMSQIVG